MQADLTPQINTIVSQFKERGDIDFLNTFGFDIDPKLILSESVFDGVLKTGQCPLRYLHRAIEYNVVKNMIHLTYSPGKITKVDVGVVMRLAKIIYGIETGKRNGDNLVKVITNYIPDYHLDGPVEITYEQLVRKFNRYNCSGDRNGNIQALHLALKLTIWEHYSVQVTPLYYKVSNLYPVEKTGYDKVIGFIDELFRLHREVDKGGNRRFIAKALESIVNGIVRVNTTPGNYVSLLHAVGNANLPYDLDIKVRFTLYLKLFTYFKSN